MAASSRFHLSARREIAPIVFGIGLFVAANVGAYCIRAIQAQESARTSDDSPQSSDIKRKGMNYPIWSPKFDSLGVDVGSANSRIAALQATDNGEGAPEANPPLLHTIETNI